MYHDIVIQLTVIYAALLKASHWDQRNLDFIFLMIFYTRHLLPSAENVKKLKKKIIAKYLNFFK